VQIEDQAGAKRCGHRPGKELVEADERVERVRAAVGARNDLLVGARTDSLTTADAVERSRAYADAGADVIFAEALRTLEDYRRVTESVDVPVLANITEFGVTPLFTRDELREAGVAIVLYPLSASRAAARASQKVYETIRQDGSQQAALPQMQTRDELYEVLDYLRFERALDEL
jgi:methylisocitrate lyase